MGLTVACIAVSILLCLFPPLLEVILSRPEVKRSGRTYLVPVLKGQNRSTTSVGLAIAIVIAIIAYYVLVLWLLFWVLCPSRGQN